MGVYSDGKEVVSIATNSPAFLGIPTAPTAAINTNTTQIATTAFVNNQIEQGTLPTTVALSDVPVKGGVFNGGFELAPTFVAVQTASNWIDGTAAGSGTIDKYGWYMARDATAVAASFDSTISHSGNYSLKLSTTNTTGRLYVYNDPDYSTKARLILKAATKYRVNVWVKTNNVAANSVYFRLVQYDRTTAGFGTVYTSTKLSGTNDWTLLTVSFTSDNTSLSAFIDMWNNVAGNISDAWFDDITIEEIVEDTTFTGLVPTPTRPTVSGVTTTGNIDQNQVTSDNAVSLGNNNVYRGVAQSFVPTRSKLTYIVAAKTTTVLSPSGTVTFSIRTDNAGSPSTTSLASYTYTSAQFLALPLGEVNVPLPCLLTPGTTYWWVAADSQAESAGNYYALVWKATTNPYPTMKTGDAALTTWSTVANGAMYFRTLYAKPTENVTIVCNGEKISLDADEDGLLSGAIIDIDKGTYIYNKAGLGEQFTISNDVYSASAGGQISPVPSTINGWAAESNVGINFVSTSDATVRWIIWKVNTMIPIKHLKISFEDYSAAANAKLTQISSDGVNFTTLRTRNDTAGTRVTSILETDLMNGLSTFYIRYYKGGNDYAICGIRIIEADLDTATIPSLILHPLSTQLQYSDDIILPSTVDRIYLRMAKYDNDRGVVVPHLEFCSTAVPAGRIPLKVDNSGETNAAVKIIVSETNVCTAGTGSTEGLNFIINDGEYVTITTPSSTVKVTYQIGKGTTVFTHLTMNRFYLSSNGDSDSSTKDPSHQFNFYLGMLKEGVQKIVEGVQRSINDISTSIDTIPGLISDSISDSIDIVNDRIDAIIEPYTTWSSWTPTLVWGHSSPASVVTRARYRTFSHTCFVNVYISTGASSGATYLRIPLPVAPAASTSGMILSLSSFQRHDITYTVPVAYITTTSSLISFYEYAAPTDLETLEFSVSGFYEID
jgi:hypothetical protein